MRFEDDIKKLPAYTEMQRIFVKKGYSKGIKDNMPIYTWPESNLVPSNVTPGHYVDAIKYCRIKFKDIPKKYRTREFFLHSLSGVHEDLVEYVKADPVTFNKQFFKDHIETNFYSLEFELNDFEWMPLDFIDEELVMCAMFRAINMRYVERRGDCDDWFYSVYKRKPEVLTKELYILGARCFAEKRHNVNRFLDITPVKYRTEEYYYALCLRNSTPVMEDIPENILTNSFLVNLLNESVTNISCFSESALEKEVSVGDKGTFKFWQIAIIADGYQIRDISLNEERIKFFLSLYNENSCEYRYGFKETYKRYLRSKEEAS